MLILILEKSRLIAVVPSNAISVAPLFFLEIEINF